MLTVAKKRPASGPAPSGFGAKLRAFRLAAGLTQSELAEKAGLKRLSVVRYEADHTEPAWSIVCNLAAAVGKTPNDFLD